MMYVALELEVWSLYYAIMFDKFLFFNCIILTKYRIYNSVTYVVLTVEFLVFFPNNIGIICIFYINSRDS